MSRSEIRELVDILANALTTRNYEKFLSRFSTDAIFETPFAIEGKSILHGLAEISAHFQRVAANPLFKLVQLDNVDANFWYDIENEIISVEYITKGTVISTGQIFEVASSVAHIEVKDNKILRYKDFPNTLGLAKAAGVLSQLAAQFVK